MMKAPSTRSSIPTMESGRMLIPPFPGREQVKTGGEHNDSGDDRPGTAIVFEAEGHSGIASGSPEDGQHPQDNAGNSQQGENGEERPHACLGIDSGPVDCARM